MLHSVAFMIISKDMWDVAYKLLFYSSIVRFWISAPTSFNWQQPPVASTPKMEALY